MKKMMGWVDVMYEFSSYKFDAKKEELEKLLKELDGLVPLHDYGRFSKEELLADWFTDRDEYAFETHEWIKDEAGEYCLLCGERNISKQTSVFCALEEKQRFVNRVNVFLDNCITNVKNE